MELYRIGKSTCYFRDKPVILSVASVAGPEEGKGPLGHLFDLVYRDTFVVRRRGKSGIEDAPQALIFAWPKQAKIQARWIFCWRGP